MKIGTDTTTLSYPTIRCARITQKTLALPRSPLKGVTQVAYRGPTSAHVKCLGHLCERVSGPDVGHRRFAVQSPTHFLVAMGDFSEIAERMRQEEPASLADQREMRHTTTAQEAGSGETAGEKGGGYVIVTRDGLRLQIRDKSNLQTRCDQLEFMWRATERGLWKHMAGSGYRLQAEASF